jgi:endoglucanase
MTKAKFRDKESEMFGDLLCELVQIPGPSGFESRVTARLKELIQPYVDEVRIDKIGNLIARKKGSEGKRSLAIASHTDEVSLVVVKVDDFVWFDRVGFIDFHSLPSMPVLILGAERDIPGVVSASSAHFEKGGDTKMWIDVGDRQKYITPGDPIVFNLKPHWLDDNKTILASHAIDDRIGCAALVEIARQLPKRPRHDIYLVGSAQEEIGSFGIKHFLRQVTPDWLFILDTCYAHDAIPDVKKLLPLNDALGLLRFSFTQPKDTCYPGMVNFSSPKLNQRLLDAAKKRDIPLNVCATTGAFSDANIVYVDNPEIENSHVFMGRRYSHSPHEVIDINTGVRAASLLTQAIADSEKWED